MGSIELFRKQGENGKGGHLEMWRYKKEIHW